MQNIVQYESKTNTRPHEQSSLKNQLFRNKKEKKLTFIFTNNRNWGRRKGRISILNDLGNFQMHFFVFQKIMYCFSPRLFSHILPPIHSMIQVRETLISKIWNYVQAYVLCKEILTCMHIYNKNSRNTTEKKLSQNIYLHKLLLNKAQNKTCYFLTENVKFANILILIINHVKIEQSN